MELPYERPRLDPPGEELVGIASGLDAEASPGAVMVGDICVARQDLEI
jgi:hypothetical protein